MGRETAGQLTGQRVHPQTALASSGLKYLRRVQGPLLGVRAGLELFLQLWLALPGTYRTLQHKPN